MSAWTQYVSTPIKIVKPPLEDFYDTHVNDMWLFQNRIPESFDLNSVLTRQTAEKVAFKSGFDSLLECFLPSTFARRKLQISVTGGGGGGIWS